MSKAEQILCMGCMSPTGGSAVCPHCGLRAGDPFDSDYQKPGSYLSGRRYMIGRCVEKNGEGALYVGYDNNIQQPVWIREYAPLDIARRDPVSGDILPKDGKDAQYKAQMSGFEDICNEVMRLSVTEQVVPIEAVIRQNNTIYAVYRNIRLTSLEKYVAAKGGKLPFDIAVSLLLPLCNALSLLHNDGHIHRGISPRTVYISENGKLYLWDFALSAVRTASCELQAELFNGFSAPEQYSPNGWQGAWTDIYAIAALLYWMVSGVTPPKSALVGPFRVLTPLGDLVMGLPETVATAVSAAMRPDPTERTQSVSAFAAELIARDLSSTAVYDTNKLAAERRRTAAQARTAEQGGTTSFRRQSAGKEGESSIKYISVALLFTVAILIAVIWFVMATFFPDLLSGNDVSQPPPSSVSQPGVPDPAISGGSSSEESGDAAPPGESEPDKTVPNFVGKKIDEVRENDEYEERFIFSVKEDYHEAYEEGVIYGQSPVEGTRMPNRGTIILHVSKGPNLKTMPDVVGYTLEQATDILYNVEIAFDTIEQHENAANPGTVLKSIPQAGEEFDPAKTQVYLFVSPERSIIESSRLPDIPDNGDDGGGIWVPRG